MRNFCVNKTTNERFARRTATVASDGSRSESSMSMNTTLDEYQMMAQRNADRTCGWIFNCFQMCFNQTIADQNKLYEEHMKNLNSSSDHMKDLSIEEDEDYHKINYQGKSTMQINESTQANSILL